jgi:uncharacterized membrane protein YgaE (UPF0421/DUF939 family)
MHILEKITIISILIGLLFAFIVSIHAWAFNSNLDKKMRELDDDYDKLFDLVDKAMAVADTKEKRDRIMEKLNRLKSTHRR